MDLATNSGRQIPRTRYIFPGKFRENFAAAIAALINCLFPKNGNPLTAQVNWKTTEKVKSRPRRLWVLMGRARKAPLIPVPFVFE
jgi:hypothetical protein